MAQSVVVTGGFGVLGSAVAHRFSDAGARVTRLDMAPSPRETITNVLDLGSVDLTDEAKVQEVFAFAAERQGAINVLVNVAGGFSWETLADGSLATYESMHSMNVMTTVTASKLALPHLKASPPGAIVNVGAAAALNANAGMAPYAASKAGVHRVTEALAEELSKDGIRVNAVLPTIIDTPTNRADMPDADFSEWISPEAIADVIVFLASPKARSINGALIPLS